MWCTKCSTKGMVPEVIQLCFIDHCPKMYAEYPWSICFPSCYDKGNKPVGRWATWKQWLKYIIWPFYWPFGVIYIISYFVSIIRHIVQILCHTYTISAPTMGFSYLFTNLFRSVPAQLGFSFGDLYTILGLTYVCYLDT